MKIVVIGGTGLIGTKLVNNLRELGHEVLAASPRKGVNAVTGEGLTEALVGAEIVVDVSNSPSFEDKAVLEFFEASRRNLLAAEAAAGVKYHVALSVVGLEHLPDSGYFRAKIAQEKLIEASPIPYTILRATQFFEFVSSIIYGSTVGDTLPLTSALVQPLAADDVAAVLTDVVLAEPVNGIIEVAGPDSIPLDELARKFLKANNDDRQVTTDVNAGYFGATIDDKSLRPDEGARLGAIHFEEWLQQNAPQR